MGTPNPSRVDPAMILKRLFVRRIITTIRSRTVDFRFAMVLLCSVFWHFVTEDEVVQLFGLFVKKWVRRQEMKANLLPVPLYHRIR
jgi:hypothetical protein